MSRRGLALSFSLFVALQVQGETPDKPMSPATWYERILQRINPDGVDYGAMWEERKQEFIRQLSNPYLQYSLGATVGLVLLLTVAIAQRLSYRRAVAIATQSITDVVRHDAYSRNVADEAIRRYNEHIEACNRVIELGQDGLGSSMAAREAALQVLKRQLADVRQENGSLREELKKSRQSGKEPAATEGESAPGQYIARIQSLEKQLREEQRKNQQAKRTSVDDHRA
jgi:hypothetical protein